MWEFSGTPYGKTQLGRRWKNGIKTDLFEV
jgi:hypothetical protein